MPWTKSLILLKCLLRYIVKAGSVEGGAGSGSEASIWGRISATLRGRKLTAEPIAVQGVNDDTIAAAAKVTEGFSGKNRLMLNLLSEGFRGSFLGP